ncbi:MAG: ribonuclease III [Patescibacteria group bacterium]
MIKTKLLLTALTHRSAVNETKGNTVSNERLEFLGDAVLELIVSDYLYQHYPDKPEGELTKLRAELVQTKTLGAAAQNLKLGEMMLLSAGEKHSGGQNNPSILADCFEAVVGSIYLDHGLAATISFINNHLIALKKTLLKQAQIVDYKSKLQMLWQKKYQVAPSYKIVGAKGPEHKKTFTVNVYLKQKAMGQGIGLTKQAAQQQAAKSAIIK